METLEIYTTKLNKDDADVITRVMGDYIDRDHCWGIDEKFRFFPSVFIKRQCTTFLSFIHFKLLRFITEFINYSVDFYVKAKCHYKHECRK
jgi:hypothetical protein